MAKIIKNKTRRSHRKFVKYKIFDIIKNNTENNMKQEIRKNNKNLTIKLSVPLKTRRHNPYEERENDDMNNIVGMIAGDEIGFAYRLDRSYKDKEDDISAPFYLYQGEVDDFRNLCQELDIEIVEYPICAYCFSPIFGAFTVGAKGNLCFECEKSNKTAV